MREKAGHQEEPTASVLDSQSVKTMEEAQTKGYDAGKKVKGRKRHLLVDTLGLVLLVWMSTADVQDRDAAQAVLPLAAHEYPTLQKIASVQHPLTGPGPFSAQGWVLLIRSSQGGGHPGAPIALPRAVVLPW